MDARMLGTAGIGTYLAEVLPRVVALMDDTVFTVLGDEPTLVTLLEREPRVRIRPWAAPIYSIREQLDVARLIDDDAALFWAPHFNIPLAWRGPLAVTVHDVAHLALPQSSIARTLYARTVFATLRRRASVLLCDSAFTESEFRARVGAPRRAVVCHLGVDERWFELPVPNAPVTPYLLYVGNVKPHKNLGRLIDAFTRIAPKIPHRLVIVGRSDGMRTIDRDVASRARSLGGRVELAGYKSPAELEQCIAGCAALVLPSLYEGFGLPPLEALACGRAVAVSRAASLPEVCGPEAVYFDPLDVADIASAIERLAVRPPDTSTDVERRRTWARRFSWDTCARIVASELRRLVTPLAMASAGTHT